MVPATFKEFVDGIKRAKERKRATRAARREMLKEKDGVALPEVEETEAPAEVEEEMEEES